MTQYIQLERTTSGIIDISSNVIFNETPLVSSTLPAIIYNAQTGVLTLPTAGLYHIEWFVSPQTSHSLDGINFALQVVDKDSSDNIISTYSVTASNHLKVSQLSGFAIIEATAHTSFSLVNTSAAGVALSDSIQIKAGLAVFSIASSSALPELGFIHLQSDTNNSFILDVDAPIPFDYPLSLDPYGIITQDSVTTVNLSLAGTYLVTYEIPCYSTAESPTIEFTLLLDGAAHSSTFMPLPIGVISASSIVTTTQADTLLSIQNTTSDTVRLDARTNLVITQIR